MLSTQTQPPEVSGDFREGCWRDQVVFRFFSVPHRLATAIAWAGLLLWALLARARAAWRRTPEDGVTR